MRTNTRLRHPDRITHGPITLSARADWVFKLADDFGYLSKGRPENAKFMVTLVDSAIGRELAQFMPKAEVKTYLKDAVLNRYAKDRRKLLANVDAYLTPLFPTQKQLVYEKPMSCSLHKCSN
ncbi:MAG: hypothetical protein MUF51_09165, partial [Vicinamibacteria bacterium]|nr:hypothetical protein [Vicinamibacteria bacterium]